MEARERRGEEGPRIVSEGGRTPERRGERRERVGEGGGRVATEDVLAGKKEQ